MDLLGFGAQVVFTSASGVISPGPLFFANLVYGSKQGIYSGIRMALGHTIVELPLIIILASGLSTFSSITTSNLVAKLISLSGGIVILVFSAVQIIAFLKKKNGEKKNIYFNTDNKKDPFIIGSILSALNPFFILWWLTAGLKLISDSLDLYGFAMGIVVVFSFHIWMDYSWLAVTAHLISRGTLIFRSKYYPILLLALNAALIYYGISFIVTGLNVT
ncbi:MAG: lysE [Nitrososphaeraceae archaeon]|jgi:threonine/homoserine/homoserine lactone efflux protein|nr:lysE [Nitrososphaeraceae archaeon]MDF2769895.1 lysE [Nitrososphaeraceae archaeon]